MNLGTEELIPFKTKALTRDGRKVVYVGQMNGTSWPFGFAVKDAGDGDCFITCNHAGGGSANGRDCPDDIVQIVQKWHPAPGDVVKVVGLLLRHDVYGSMRDFLRANPGAVQEWVVVRQHSASNPGFFYVKNPNSGDEYLAYRDSMRLVRRRSL